MFEKLMAWLGYFPRETEVGAEALYQYVEGHLVPAERELTKGATHVLDEIRAILASFDHRADITWKEIHMALADIIATATTGVTANTSAFADALTKAVAAATAPLQAELATANSDKAALQAEIDAANTAAGALTNAVTAQTTAAQAAGTV